MTIPNPLVAAAAVLVAVEAALAAVGVELPALSLATLALAPGLALAALLPEPARREWTSLLAAAPALGFGLVSVALITLASAGASLDPWLVRALLAAFVIVGALLPELDPPARAERPELLAGLGLLGVVVLGVVLQLRVIGGYPVPGNDWAKYVLYADEIRAHGSLLIDNPFWMLGVPFRDDPGVPAVYGAYVGLGSQPAVAVAHGIGLFAVMQTLAMFALVRSFWARGAAVAAAALWAAVPLNTTILGWHGLANVAAFPLLTLLLIYAGSLVLGELRGSAAVGAGLTLVALAAAHRLSLFVGLAALGAAAVVGLASASDRRAVLRGLGLAALAGALASAGVLYDLITRNNSFGGTLPYKAYISSKLDLGLLVRDLTWPFVVVVVAAVVVAIAAARRDRALIPLLCLLTVTAALACSYLVHFPLHYTRMAYYLPLALVPLVAIALWKLPGPQAIAAGAAGVLAAYLFAVSFAQGDNVDRFYSFTGAGSLRGLDAVAADLRPDEVVVTDRCWSFLATWLLHTRTLPALDSSDIQPKAELPFARRAHAVLAGTPRGRADARRLGVRFLLVDPGCTDSDGKPTRPPRIGRPVFVSRRLVVLRLG